MKRTPKTPFIVSWLLERTLPTDVQEEISGDLEELFRDRCERYGLLRARLWYWREGLSFSRRFLWERLRDRADGESERGGATPQRAMLRSGRLGAGVSWLDVKLGLRMLVKHPGLTLVGGLALTVAIGMGAAFFEFTNDFVHPRLPLEDGERIVGIYNWDATAGSRELRSLHDFVLWRDELESIEDLGAFRRLERNLITEDGRAEPIAGREISAAAFRLARVPPLLGRPLIEADEEEGAPPVVVIGHSVWQSRFGGDPSVVGQTVQLGRSTSTVVGVMPEDFAFPTNDALWTPLRLNVSDYERLEGPGLFIFGRLAPGVTLDEAQAELTTIGQHTAADHPLTNAHLRPRLMPYIESLLPTPSRWQLYLIHSSFLMVLLVVCGNVATLVFARTATREGEIVVRSALGASRGRIIGQLFIEALVLASFAAVLGLVVAGIGLKWGMDMATGGSLWFWWNPNVSPSTVLYVGILTVLGAAIVGVLPALKVTGRGIQVRLRNAGGSGGSGVRLGKLSTAMIITQVALTVAILPDGVFEVWELVRHQAADVGFATNEYLSVRLETDREGAPDASREGTEPLSRIGSTYQELQRRLAEEPGVISVTFASVLPGMEQPRARVEVEGDAAPPSEVNTAAVDVGFFDALRTPVLSGRAFDSGDLAPERRAVIVNQSFAQQNLGERNPIGQRIRYINGREGEANPWYEIVGVVTDLGANPVSPDATAGIYRPLALDPTVVSDEPPVDHHLLHMAVRVRDGPESFVPRLRSLAATVDPGMRLYDSLPLDEVRRQSQREQRFGASIFAVVAATALLLSAAGLYSLMSFAVAQRTREIGIRAALGAHPQRIATAIFSRALAQVGVGVLIGCLGAVFLFDQVATSGLGLLLPVAGLMIAVGFLACAVPARRALRIQPTEALRQE